MAGSVRARVGGRESPSTVGDVSVVFRATDEPVRTRLDYWRHVLGGTLGLLDLQAPADPDFRDRLVAGQLGALHVGDISVHQPGVAHRTLKHVRREPQDVWYIGVQTRGRAVIEQGGRQARLGPGDMVLLDLARPCRWITGPARATALAFPRELLPLRADDVQRTTAVRIPGDEGPGALVSALARQLPGQVDSYGTADAARVGTATIDLVTAALGARMDREGLVPPPVRQRALLLQVTEFVERHLGDPDLSPATIAAAQHISVRYLHKLFRPDGVTVGEWIRQRRLERCRHDLLDPAQRERTVTAIAARWGFTSPAHFSRVFRDAFGVSPSEYRTHDGRRADDDVSSSPAATSWSCARSWRRRDTP